MNALKAKEFYRRDVQYIVKNGKALIINEVLPAILYAIILITRLAPKIWGPRRIFMVGLLPHIRV